jgi:alkanesulfonate monooxygenase SsuD/methylene tetrahydromethanopterin reductase-like flavin-dependent oxidoreductase (luciferase family)
MSRPVIGAVVRPQASPEQMIAAFRAAEESGLDELWLWEDCFAEDGLTMAGVALGMTSRVRVGIGVMPFPLRSVAVAAMAVGALQRAFPGRFIAGFGHGVQSWMGQAGVKVASILTLEREYVTALRRLLAGEEVTVAGRYVTLDAVRLAWPPDAVPPIHLSATGPKSMELSGELGDGTVYAGAITLDDMAVNARLIAAGRAAAGRTGSHEVTVLRDVPGRDPAAARAEIDRYAAAGAHRVVLVPAPDEPDPAGYIRFVAERVQ